MKNSPASAALPPTDELATLIDWIGASTGAEVVSCDRLPTVRPAWKVHTRGAAGERAYVLRCARPSGFGLADVYTLEREAAIVNALGALALPVPRIIGMHSAPDAMLLEFMPGSADFAALDRDPQQKSRIVDHFIELLGVLHAATPEQLGLHHALPLPRAATDHALMELSTWEKLYRNAARAADPLLLFALRWLRRNAPAATATVLVQGDTGPNQCLFREGGISAVLDWELAHFGDPMEDLGWIAARSFFMDFGRLKALFARYSALTGTALDTGKIHYYRIMALVKCAIATGLAREGMGPEDDIASIISWDAVNRMALAICFMAVLRQQTGADRPAPPTGSAGAQPPLYALLQENFRNFSAHEDNAFQKARLQGLAEITAYLALEAAQRAPRQQLAAAELRAVLSRCAVDAGGGADALLALIEMQDPRHDIALANYFYRTEHSAIALLEQALGKRVQCLVEAID
jgi:aminoglycoside phosphotransferase (APT) family kinase protein